MSCTVAGCSRKMSARGMCSAHYNRARQGKPLDTPFRVWGTAHERLDAGLDKSGDCWVWTGSTSDDGYGHISDNGRHLQTHRLSYEREYGPIPDGKVIDHLCRNRACARPDHLRIATVRQNNAAGLMGFALTGRCRSGRHDVTDPANVYIEPNGVKRMCRACQDDRKQRRAKVRAVTAHRARAGQGGDA